MKTKKNTIHASKFMAAVGMFGMESMSALYDKVTLSRMLNESRDCLYCGRRHKHNNAFCDADCCKDWRADNPQQGRANHSHDPKTGLVELKMNEVA